MIENPTLMQYTAEKFSQFDSFSWIWGMVLLLLITVIKGGKILITDVWSEVGEKQTNKTTHFLHEAYSKVKLAKEVYILEDPVDMHSVLINEPMSLTAIPFIFPLPL